MLLKTSSSHLILYIGLNIDFENIIIIIKAFSKHFNESPIFTSNFTLNKFNKLKIKKRYTLKN